MRISVWDTYVQISGGETLHFDVMVEETFTDEKAIYDYARQYVKSMGYDACEINTSNCRFCHIEEADEIIENTIREKGYYIQFLHRIPAKLPTNPVRRDVILYLRSKYVDLRYADFSDKSLEDVLHILKEREG